MSQIEQRFEFDANRTNPDFSGESFTPEQIAAGEHRAYVGGVWDSHGQRQLDFLIGQGLRPRHRLVDIGCGAFRAGRHFIDYLDAGNYYGVDSNHSVMQAGWDTELTDEQRQRQPLENLRANDRFDTDFGARFDFAIANSVFTHVSLNHIRLCMYRLDQVMAPGGSFYATYFVRPDSVPIDEIKLGSGKRGKAFYTEKNNYTYYRHDLRWAARWGDWKYEYIGDWGHPGNQKMVRYTKLTADEIASRAAKARTAAPSPAPPNLVTRVVRRAKRTMSR